MDMDMLTLGLGALLIVLILQALRIARYAHAKAQIKAFEKRIHA